MKNILKLSGIFLIAIFIAGAIYSNISKNDKSITQQGPKNLIVGTWDGLEPDAQGLVWIFKSNGTMKERADDNYISYKLVLLGATKNQCPDIGMTSSSKAYDSNQLVLIRMPKNKNNICYVVSFLGHDEDLNATLLNLWSASNGNHLAFEKRK